MDGGAALVRLGARGGGAPADETGPPAGPPAGAFPRLSFTSRTPDWTASRIRASRSDVGDELTGDGQRPANQRTTGVLGGTGEWTAAAPPGPAGVDAVPRPADAASAPAGAAATSRPRAARTRLSRRRSIGATRNRLVASRRGTTAEGRSRSPPAPSTRPPGRPFGLAECAAGGVRASPGMVRRSTWPLGALVAGAGPDWTRPGPVSPITAFVCNGRPLRRNAGSGPVSSRG